MIVHRGCTPLLVGVLVCFSAAAAPPGPTRTPIQQLALPTVASAGFVENRGQFDPAVRFQFKTPTGTLWVTNKGLVFDIAGGSAAEATRPSDLKRDGTNAVQRFVFAADFDDADLSTFEAKGPLPGIHNFLTADPAKSITGVRSYRQIVAHGIWPGIDLRLIVNGVGIEQEFILQAEADPTLIRISYRGANDLKISEDGSLVLTTPVGQLTESRPRVYQDIGGRRVPVAARFKLTSQHAYAFDLSEYDTQHSLVVDPTLLFSTFLGGSGADQGYGLAVDSTGNIYVTGRTTSSDFPITVGQTATTVSAMFITKLNPAASALVYSTYIQSPTPWWDSTYGRAIAVDASGQAYIAGWSYVQVNPYPTTPNRFQACGTGSSLFVTKLNTTGDTTLYSSCIGSNYYMITTYVTQNLAIAADDNGRAYLVGTSLCGLPVTPNAFQTTCHQDPGGGSENAADAFLAVFDTKASGSASLLYSTYLGGTWTEIGTGVALDSSGNVYVTGSTRSPDFPVTSGAYQTTVPSKTCQYYLSHIPCFGAFVSKFNTTLSGTASLIYSTHLGSGADGQTQDFAYAIAVDTSGAAYVTGNTSSSAFPTTPGALQVASGGSHAFVTKLNAGGSKLVYSTYFGGSNQTTGNAISVDIFGNAHLAGQTSGSNFPVTADAFQGAVSKLGGSTSGFFSKLNGTGSALIYSTYLGGNNDDIANAVAIDQTGDAYVSGYTTSPNFPVVGTVYQTALRGSGDAFVAKIPLSGVFRVLGFSPSHGGNVGAVTLAVFGSGFHAGVTAKLVGGSQVVQATSATVSSGGRILYPTFDLSGSPPGVYAVVVTDIAGTSLTAADTFTVEQGGTIDLSVGIIGRSSIRGGRPQIFSLQVTNSGTINADNVGVFLLLPTGMSADSSNPTQFVAYPSDQGTVVSTFVNVRAGESVSIPISVVLSDAAQYGHLQFLLQAWLSYPNYSN